MINQHKLKKLLEPCPKLYLWVLNIKRLGHWSRDWIVTRDSDITIEGYPRSSNSFARSAFKKAQSQEYSIATHVHSYAQVLRSVELKKPTMVLLRQPRDACLSLVALTLEMEEAELTEKSLDRTKTELLNNFDDYIEFYRRVLTVPDGVIIAEFKCVISDYGEIIRRMNARYQTSFDIYVNTDENDKAVFSKGGFHLSPSQGRNAIKEYLKTCLEIPEVKALADQAHAVYEQVLAVEKEQAKQYGSPTAN